MLFGVFYEADTIRTFLGKFALEAKGVPLVSEVLTFDLPASGTASVTVNKPGTTAGAYTITVTAKGNDAAATTATTMFTVTVN